MVIFMDHFDRFWLKEHNKCSGRAWNQLGGETLLDFNYPGDLNVKDENISELMVSLIFTEFRVAE